MVDAGIPILQSLEALSEQTANPTFKIALVAIREGHPRWGAAFQVPLPSIPRSLTSCM